MPTFFIYHHSLIGHYIESNVVILKNFGHSHVQLAQRVYHSLGRLEHAVCTAAYRKQQRHEQQTIVNYILRRKEVDFDTDDLGHSAHQERTRSLLGLFVPKLKVNRGNNERLLRVLSGWRPLTIHEDYVLSGVCEAEQLWRNRFVESLSK